MFTPANEVEPGKGATQAAVKEVGVTVTVPVIKNVPGAPVHAVRLKFS